MGLYTDPAKVHEHTPSALQTFLNWNISAHFYTLLSFLRGSSRCSDWLRAGRPRGRSSSPGTFKTFCFSKASRPALGSTQPLFQWVSGDFPPVVKWPGREADHLPPTSAEIQNMWIYISTPPYAFMA
jgi:hypothetical protein